MIFIASLENDPTAASFKVDPDKFELLIEMEGIVPAPYLDRYKWVRVDEISRISRKKWGNFFFKSYSLVVSKFSKKKKKLLNIQEYS